METIERAVRKFVFDYFLRERSAPAPEEIAREFAIPPTRAFAVLKRLDESHDLKLLEGTSRILMAFPFSAISTPFRVVRENGARYFANCAWDAIAFHPMLKESVEIQSFCRHCASPLRFGVSHNLGVSHEGGLPIVYLALPAAEWWTDIVRTCANTMSFFETWQHLSEWTSDGNDDRGVSLSVDQVIRISEPIYSGKMELGYRRPPKEKIQRHFEKLGLTGDFWTL